MALVPFGGEVGAWSPTLTGDSTDWIGDNDGTPTGGVTVVRDRSAGGLQAWDFDETNSDRVAITLGTTSTEWMLTAWVYFPSITTENRILDSSGSERVIFGTEATTGYLRFYAGAAQGWQTSTTTAPIGRWCHVAYTLGSSGDRAVRMYLDGNMVYESVVTILITPGGAGNIGSNYLGTANFTTMLCDDVRWFDKALEPSEIKELSTKAGYQRSAQTFGPIGKWSPSEDKFGAASGDAVAHDLSGNGNVGTLEATATYINDSDVGGRKAFDLTTSGDRVSIPTTSMPLQDATYMGWVKSYTTVTNDQSGFIQYVQDADNRFGLILSLNVLWMAYTFNGTTFGTYVQFSDDGFYTHNEWNHIAVVYPAEMPTVPSDIKVYINGQLANMRSWGSPSSLALAGYLTIGARFSSFNANQEVDSVTCYDYALTADQIKFLSGSRTAELPYTLPGCVGQWAPTLDPRSVADVTGPLDLTFGGNNGTLEGTATYDVADTDKSGSAAFEFPAGGDCVSGTGMTMTNNFTYSGWQKFTGGGGLRVIFGAASAVSTNNGWNIAINNAVFAPSMEGNFQFGTYQSQLNVWEHWAVTIIDDTMRLYVDGVLSNTVVLTALSSQPDAWQMGESIQSGVDGKNYPGLIDNVQLYDRVLNAVEIEQLAAWGRPGQPVAYNRLCGQGRNNSDTALEGRYLLDDTSGNDSSGHGRDGVMEGAPATGTGPAWIPSAVDFNGSTQALDLNDAGVALNDLDQWSLLMRLNCSDTVQSEKTAFSWGGNASSWTSNVAPYFQKLTPSFIYGRVNQNGSTYNEAVSTAVDQNWRNHGWIKKVGAGVDLYEDSVNLITMGANVTTQGNTDRTAIGKNAYLNSNFFPGMVCDFAALSRALQAVEIEHYDSGPEPIYIGDTLPFFKSTPTEGVALFVNPGTWGLDPSFGAGTNGLLTWHYDWYIMDDDTGTNKAYLETTTEPEGYTPVSADVGKFLQVKVTGVNDGGIDTSEEWWTLPAEVQSGGPPASFEPAWAVSQKQVQS